MFMVHHVIFTAVHMIICYIVYTPIGYLIMDFMKINIYFMIFIYDILYCI